MAQQITIDIVAETKKLTSGINDANKQLGTMTKGLKAAATAATAAASAFVLKKGISFLKDGIEEAKDARLAMNNATSAFGEGSDALKKITADAEKFGKQLGMDNDDILKLATSLGSRLPADAKASAAELVNLAKDVEAFTGGAINAEAFTSKLAKAFADGEISAKELTKIVPGLDAATYKMAETMSKAGDNQGALNLLIEAGQKKYGDAAEKNVTASQKFDVALANLKETIGTKILPILESAVDFLTKLIEVFSALPGPVQNVVLGLTAIVGIGGPLLGFLASAKTSLVTLGLVSEGAAVGTNLLSVAMKAIPIMAVIALIVLLIANWDDVTAAAKKVWEAINKWWGKVYDDIKEFAGKAIDWIKDNWPLLLGILTGPFGLFAVWIVTHFEEIKTKVKDGWEAVKTIVTEKVTGIFSTVMSWFYAIRDYIANLFIKGKDTIFSVLEDGWNLVKDTIVTIVEIIYTSLQTVWLKIVMAITEFISTIVTAGVDKFNELKDKTLAAFEKLRTGASEIWEKIKDFITGAVDNIKNKFGEVYGKMIEVGKDIARGIGAGLTSMTGWFKTILGDWIQRNIPDWVKTVLKIQSPSKIMAGIGVNIAKGLINGVVSGATNIVSPKSLTVASPSPSSLPVVNNITINAGTGTDPYAVGRAVTSAINKYSRISNNYAGLQTL